VDRDWLERELAIGRSIESVAREAGRDPSTVAYWARKHGAVSAHAERHRSKGSISREVLAELVNRGLSIRAMAADLGVSQATVRHWLGKYGLRTARAQRRRTRNDALEVLPGGDVMSICPEHGHTRFRERGDGQGWRCLACRAEHVQRRRRRIKEILVREAGGACVICGYDRSPAALHFHHLDPSTKEFHMSHGGVTRSLEAAHAEARKCALLCANCHAEVEVGAATIPPGRPGSSPG
jgi:transposase-like protein